MVRGAKVVNHDDLGRRHYRLKPDCSPFTARNLAGGGTHHDVDLVALTFEVVDELQVTIVRGPELSDDQTLAH